MNESVKHWNNLNCVEITSNMIHILHRYVTIAYLLSEKPHAYDKRQQFFAADRAGWGGELVILAIRSDRGLARKLGALRICYLYANLKGCYKLLGIHQKLEHEHPKHLKGIT